jgi:hypothetical protein
MSNNNKRLIATIYSNAIHNEQVLCAAKVWAENNGYTFILNCKPHPNPYYITVVKIECDGLTMLFDMSDSPSLVDVMDDIDCYFKRSYIQDAVSASLPYRVLPFGFNYGVAYKPFSLQRITAFGFDKVYAARTTTALAPFVNLSYTHIDYRKMYSAPYDNGGNILFQTRLWDPSNVRTPEKKFFREHLNAVRIETVRQLKNKFDKRLVAGIEDTPLARSLCPDLIIDKASSSKKSYLRELRNSDICIATNGLENTLGWRIAEYVAFSKAVVSEPFDVMVPAWKEGAHYLLFKDDLCARVDALLYQKNYTRMQQQNYEYYNQYMAPEALFNRLLKQASLK